MQIKDPSLTILALELFRSRVKPGMTMSRELVHNQRRFQIKQSVQYEPQHSQHVIPELIRDLKITMQQNQYVNCLSHAQ